jgi:hypothetical protein
MTIRINLIRLFLTMMTVWILSSCSNVGASIETNIESPPVAGDPYTRNMGGGIDYDGLSGEMSGGEMNGGEMNGGTMMGGAMNGGAMNGGAMMGGEMNGGAMVGGAPGGMWVGGDDRGGDLIPVMNDQDQDRVNDEDDNCPNDYNPEQSDIDGDGEGDACEPDRDLDGVPDAWDPAPDDVNWPGRAQADTVYAHTSSELYALDVKRLTLNFVSRFSFDDQLDHEMTDIAFDRSGVMWAVSFDALWVCHPMIGQCRYQGTLPSRFNGLTFLSGTLFGALRDVLVGISVDGTWHRLNVANGVINSSEIGSYPIESSSGDAFYIDGVGTYAAVKRPGIEDDLIINVDPLNLSAVNDIVILNGYQRIYGLAGWRGQLFAFDESGAVLLVNLQTMDVSIISDEGQMWWGAGVSSILYSIPSN